MSHPPKRPYEKPTLVRAGGLKDLASRCAGLEAMLSDANMVIADLREKGRENIRLGRENAELRAALRPFAEAYRAHEPDYAMMDVHYSHFARAAELIAGTKEGE